MSDAPLPRAIRRAAVVAVVVLVVAAWAPALDGAWQWDDYFVIVDNPRVHSLAAWAHAVPTGIRPVLSLTYALQWASGARLVDFHVVNLAIHAVASLLVFVLGRRVVPVEAAAVGAALFAVHPVQTEAVTYVSGRSASLTAAVYLSALALWPSRRSSIALFLVALGCKETAVTWPAAVVLWVTAATNGRWRTALRASAPAWGLAVIGLAAAAASSRYRDLLAFSLSLRDPLANLPVATQAVAYLTTRLVRIDQLSIDPSLVPADGWTPALAGVAAIVIGGVGWAGRALPRRPVPALAVLWYVLHLLPTASLVARADVASERHLYLALVGPALFAGSILATLVRRAPRAGAAVVLALLALLAGATHRRNRDFATEVALWTATLRVTPSNTRALNNLGWAYHRLGCIAEARAAYERAIALDPNDPFARGNLAGLSAQRPATAPCPPLPPALRPAEHTPEHGAAPDAPSHGTATRRDTAPAN